MKISTIFVLFTVICVGIVGITYSYCYTEINNEENFTYIGNLAGFDVQSEPYKGYVIVKITLSNNQTYLVNLPIYILDNLQIGQQVYLYKNSEVRILINGLYY